MTPKSAIEKYSKVIGVSDAGPTILKEQYLDSDEFTPFTDFCATRIIKDSIEGFSEKTQTFMCNLAYISMITNTVSQALRRPLDMKAVTMNLLRSYCDSFRSLTKEEIHRKRLNMFSQTKRRVVLSDNYNPSINMLTLPSVTLIQELLPKEKLNVYQVLSALQGYAFRTMPKELERPRNIKFNALRNIPIYSWVFLSSCNGVNLYMIRYDTDRLALRMDFTLPFLLPVGNLSKVTVSKLIESQLDSMAIGMKM